MPMRAQELSRGGELGARREEELALLGDAASDRRDRAAQPLDSGLRQAVADRHADRSCITRAIARPFPHRCG